MLNSIKSPSMIIDLSQVRRNILKMKSVADRHNLIFRPHFKTHQSKTIGRMFRDLGVDRITVSSIQMAEYFASDGWNDITLAFPVNIREVERIDSLAGKVRLNLLLDDEFVLNALENGLKNNVGVFIKTDTGYGRAGVPWDETETLKTLIDKLLKSSKLEMSGFISHDGHTYHEVDEKGTAIRAIRKKSLERISKMKAAVGFREKWIISIGDTPSCSICEDYEGVNEIRPGNFVFYDYEQYDLGSCQLDEIACSVALPVVGVYPKRNEIVVHGGSVHLSKDYILDDDEYGVIYGRVIAPGPVPSAGNQQEIGYIKSLSQEHGIIKVSDEYISKSKPGDLLFVIPIHSCLTASTPINYFDMKGNRIDKMVSIK